MPAIREDRGHFCVVSLTVIRNRRSLPARNLLLPDDGRQQIPRAIKPRFGMTKLFLNAGLPRLLHHLH